MKYSLGLDIGTTSVGWAVINEDKKRIEDLGVRIFERPEDPKTKESLAKPRRDARSARRRLRRRKQRLNHLKKFFIDNKLLQENLDYEELFRKYNPYEIRKKALYEKVSNEELFVAIYHIAKRRGYKSNRKKVEENNKDSKKVFGAISANQFLLSHYRSVAETLLKEDKFKAHKRNKYDDYTNSFIREDFEKEIIAILKMQKWSNEDISKLLYDEPSGILYQRPFMTKELLNKMRGNCPYEPGEKRAWKNSYTFEMFKLAQDLAHVTYNEGEKFNAQQISDCVKICQQQQSVTYKKIREVIWFKNDNKFHFDHIKGKSENSYDEQEKHEFCKLKFYHDIKRATKNSPEDWARIEGNPDLFDSIGEILTFEKEDARVEDELDKLNLSKETLSELMKLSYSQFAHLSIKALRKITPILLNGNTYLDAIREAYPEKANEKLQGSLNELPALTEEQNNQITNPVVKRAISQTRKVVNAVIKKYGAPSQIKIECTNELAKNAKDRTRIERAQKENAERNERILGVLKENFNITNPTGQQIVKYRLREEQLNKCQYCGKPLGPEIFMDDKLSEVDHIIPFSRCGNDGRNNKVLVCTSCNQEKKNLTPYEKWGSNASKWQSIVDLAQNPKISFQKRNRILSEKIPAEEWNTRALNDTRYIMRFMSNYIKSNLKFANDGGQKVVLPTGFITSYLRKMYHLGDKDREANSCHHAVDACVIATISQGQIQKISRWNKYKELGAKHSTITIDENGDTHQVTKTDFAGFRAELLPWPDFDKEVRLRSGVAYNSEKIENLADFRDRFKIFDSYDETFRLSIHPMFVSRMPKRSIKGKATLDTIRSPKTQDGDDNRLTRKRLAECSLKDIQNSVLPESDKALYEQLLNIVAEKGEGGLKEKIYKNNKKTDKNGNPISPVSTIKVYSKEPSGLLINRGSQFVNNGDMACLKIYRRKNQDGIYKYYCAPVYVHSAKKIIHEILPTPKGANRSEKEDLAAIRDVTGRIFATEENGFEEVATVFQNDYVRFIYSDGCAEGYYVKYNISNGAISLISHNSAQKDSLFTCGINKVIDFMRLNISVLGDNYQEYREKE